MNFLVMLGMMGLALIFFHGRGHHRPSPEPNHHATKPAGAPVPQPEAPGSSRQSGESHVTESIPDTKGTPVPVPASPSTPPLVTQAE